MGLEWSTTKIAASSLGQAFLSPPRRGAPVTTAAPKPAELGRTPHARALHPATAMLEHILIAVDGSGPSRHAARFGLALAKEVGAKVTLLTVLQRPEVIPMGPLGTSLVSPSMSDADLAHVRAQLDAIAAEAPNVKVERAVEMGPIAETIVDYAAHQSADMIVLGARGLGPAKRLLLGSVSDRVVHAAHCPVTVWR